MQTKAAVVRTKGGSFLIEDVVISEPQDDQILVKIVGAGMCHTDLIVRDQDYEVPLPMVLGHEGSGIVEKIGKNVTKVKPGDHVVLSFYSCGSCRNCLARSPLSCENAFPFNFGGRMPNGDCCIHAGDEPLGCSFFGQSSFSGYALSYECNTIPVDKSVPLEMLGPLGCGIQTGAGSVLNALNPPAGSDIVIFGAGAVGLSAVMGAVIANCTTIISIDIKENRLELASELGATHVINGLEDGNPVDKIMGITGGLGASYMLETTGNPKVLEEAIFCLKQGGEGGIVGAPAMGTTVSIDVNFMLFNRHLRGIIEGDSNSDIFIPRLIELYKQGKFPFDKLIKYYTLDQINQAAADSESGVTLKPVLKLT